MKELLAAALIVAAPAVPVSPTHTDVADLWINPAVRPGEGEYARVELVETPRLTQNKFHVKLRVTNEEEETLEGLRVALRSASPVASAHEQRVAAVASVGEYGAVGGRRDVDKRLLPGAEVELEMEAELPAPGVYPMMLQLIDASGATLDTERFHVAAGEAEEAKVSVLYPVSAPVDIVPGETGEAPETPPLVLASEHLAGELAPGGRLDELVDVYLNQPDEVGYASCMALDPALVDVVERMSRGYAVALQRKPVVEEPKRLRDSWGSAEEFHAEEGAGAQDAAAWLDKVRRVSATGCTVALPWANADLGAVARTGDQWLVREAIERGPFVLQRVLGTPGALNVVIPASGYVEDPAPLGWADHTRSTVPLEGMQAAWERTPRGGEAQSQNALDRREFTGNAAAPPPSSVVKVLAAGASESVAVGIDKVGYQDDLASILAATGEAPETTAYSDAFLRFDYSMDSKIARDVSAAAAVQGAARSNEQIFVAPPATWDADTAAAVLGSVAQLLNKGTAIPFAEYLAAPPELGAVEISDPAAYSDAEVLQVTQQEEFINDLTALMVPDPAIALTRYGFTLPLRRDLLSALPPRRALSLYDDSVSTTSTTLTQTRNTLNDLRSSVALIPPGNVYTRTSQSSPLLIVAKNGLPLPVEARLLFSGPGTLNVPDSLRVPARGSVTVQMTADLPGRGTDLQLYLASMSGQPISQPVEISVRTSGAGWPVAAGLGSAALLFLVLVRGGRRRKAKPSKRQPSPSRERSTT